jgi:hypothetical protein
VIHKYSFGFQLLTTVRMEIVTFWIVAQYSSESERERERVRPAFGGKYELSLHG